ncbi:actin-like ATPase domain-containing protein [Coemansia reversa NRRL 1564]|uniref:Actin-like ATPase domain-containing protein n=1 Tax=Coemansia reversa (strain ATCC 12441 / NRRL 1564) TaxID=763665 RepID=A0A2G5BES8_COERN|nr:actin-like ATPase domain-containing protein [Coemansia reversa NRRL 1564]|eukprot:PIA17536.1 actin-like ATPase domain-containing protein [Coemansia reversa NRRL 1564]
MVALNREESFVVIELGSHTTKAMRDITDVNKLPSVCIPTHENSLERTVDIIPDGFVGDWDVLSAFLRHIVTKELGIRISDNNSTIMISTPALWPKGHLENLAQIAFEHLNAPAIVIMEQSQLAVYGNGAVTGVVVDMGHCLTTVAPVIDSCVQSSCIAQTPVAGAAVNQHLRDLLQADPATRAQFDSGSVPLEFAVALKESGLCRLQLTPTDGASENDTTETQSFVFGGKEYAVSKQIMAKAPEILVKPTDPSAPTLASLIRQAVLGCETGRRTQLWESIHLIGGSSQFPGIKDYLQLELENAILPASNIFALSQTRDIKFCSLPEYFVGWRNHDHRTSFLGACIVGKIVLTDARHLISRAEYNDSGPSIIHTKSF